MEKLVQYDKFCEKCKHFKTDEVDEPCDECLAEPTNDDSHKPVYFKESSQNGRT